MKNLLLILLIPFFLTCENYPTNNAEEAAKETVIIQRRCLRAARDIASGEQFSREMISVLRPASKGGIYPYEVDQVLGTKAITDIQAGEELRWTQLGE